VSMTSCGRQRPRGSCTGPVSGRAGTASSAPPDRRPPAREWAPRQLIRIISPRFAELLAVRPESRPACACTTNNVVGLPPKFVASAYWAASLSVTFSPLPPTQDRRVGLLDALRLVDGTGNLVELAVERGVWLGPHGADHLERLAQHLQPLAGGRAVLVAVGLCIRARTSRRQSRNRAGRGSARRRWRPSGQQRRVAVAVDT